MRGETIANPHIEVSDGVVRLADFHHTDIPMLVTEDYDPELRRRFGAPEDFEPSAQHSARVLERWRAERDAGARFTFAVRDAESNALLGGCELQPRAMHVANLSYWTYRGHRTQGVASRAVALAARFSFETLGLNRLEILTDSDNVASQRIALKNQFSNEGTREGRILLVLKRPESAT